jgi:hypothetical protein
MKVTINLLGHDFTLDTQIHPEAAFTYTLAYGLKKNLNDVVAGDKKEILAETPDISEDDLKEKLLTAMIKRFDNIVAGKMESKEYGPRLGMEAKMLKEVTEYLFKTWWAANAKGVPMPKAERYNQFLTAWSKKPEHVASVESEVTRRKEAAAAMSGGSADMDALLKSLEE